MARYKRYGIFIALIMCVHLSKVQCNTPADHLVPPPLQLPYNQRLPQRPDDAGVMATIAKWFGFGEYDDSVENQIQPQASYKLPHFRLPPPYPTISQYQGNIQHLQHYKFQGPVQYVQQPQIQPQTQTQPQSVVTQSQTVQQQPQQPQPYNYNPPKEPCNTCNKLPWIPVYNGLLPQPVALFPENKQPAIPVSPPQYAPTFAIVPHINAHINAVPQIFNPEPFRIPGNTGDQILQQNQHTPRQIPQYVPQPLTPTKLPDFEIVPSREIGTITEIQYPIDVSQSPVLDISQKAVHTNLIDSNDTPHLTEIGSFVTIPPSSSSSFPPTVQPNFIYQSSSQTPAPEIIYQNSPFPPNHKPLAVVHSSTVIPLDGNIGHRHNELDNSPAASSYNITISNHNTIDGIYEVDHGSANEEIFVQPERNHLLLNEVQRPQRQNMKKMRDTPKNLLDSPIHYGHGGSSPRPFTKDPSLLSIRGTSQKPNPLDPTPTSTYSSLDASGHYAGISPPSSFQNSVFGAKKPKRVEQYLLPYNTKVKPRPFQKQENFITHETKAATDAPLRKTTKYLTKILASNLRELLKKEQEQNSTGIDIRKLQNKIDGWTEEEFTSVSHKASTVAIRGRSKSIPGEYLTTTPSLKEIQTHATEPTPAASHKREYFSIDRGSKKYTYLTRSKHIENNKIEDHEEVSTGRTTTPSYVRNIFTETSPHPWVKTEVKISPLTKERIYVVTPQPLLTKPTATFIGDNVGTFKSPRFLDRPTVSSKKRQTYTPELFGLMGLSSFVPDDPVETSAGHSKVITVVTPSISTSSFSSSSSSSSSSVLGDSRTPTSTPSIRVTSKLLEMSR